MLLGSAMLGMAAHKNLPLQVLRTYFFLHKGTSLKDIGDEMFAGVSDTDS
jgi:hypothetical protein